MKQKQHHGNGVKERGKPSIEFYKDGKPQYYCYGYIDNADNLLEECQRCPEHVYKAQEDLQNYKRNNK